MDSLTILKVLLLGLVEGVTEFLPISSTGHLIIVADWINFPGHSGLDDATSKAFLVFIQLGAILAVVCIYWRTFWEIARDFYRPGRSQRLLLNLVIGTLPAVIVGLPTEEWIEKHLMRPLPVAATLVAGGIAILFVERFVKHAPGGDVHDISWKGALGVGCFQVLAILFPGMSRSGSTILGGLSLGLSRKTATEFSFFLAVPAMCGASIIKLYSAREGLSTEAAPIFALGFVAAFLSALVVVRWLLHFVARHTFVPFAWYRIVFGAVLLAMYANAASFPQTETGEPSKHVVQPDEVGPSSLLGPSNGSKINTLSLYNMPAEFRMSSAPQTVATLDDFYCIEGKAELVAGGSFNFMDIIARKRLNEFAAIHPNARSGLAHGYRILKPAEVHSFAKLRRLFPSADQVGNLTVFKIGGYTARTGALATSAR